MGLFSKIGGIIGSRASSLSGKFTKQISNVPFIGRASKFILGGTKLARIATPVGGIIGAVGVAKFLSKVFPNPKETPFQTIARKNSALRATRKDIKVKQTVEIAKKGGFLKKAIGIGALVAGTAFIAEQIAEKVGVRGGAGFIGRRKPVKKKAVRKKRVKRRVGRKRRARRKPVRKKRTHRSPRHKGHKRVSFTTKDGKKVNFLVRKKGGVSHRRRRRKK